jgi:mannose-1-phosphate guanylyltransferase
LNRPALVLAAGFGSRIAAAGAPKPLLPFRGRRLIEWNLVWLASHGVRDVWVNLHHRGDEIRNALGDGGGTGVRIRYSEEREILGTAGGWRAVSGELGGRSLVIYGDNLMRFDLHALDAAHEEGGGVCTVALFDAARHGNTGIAGGHAVVDDGGRIVEFREGQPAGGSAWLVNAGAYVIGQEGVNWVAEGFQDFGRDVFPRLAAAGLLRAHVIEDTGFCLGLDTPECFARAEAMAAAGEVLL